jgi:hypothetical protein
MTEALLKALAKSTSVTVGIHAEEGAAAKKEPGSKSATDTVADAAAGAEFGIGQPARSFVGGWVDEQEGGLTDELRKVCEPVAAGKRPLDQALARFGLWAVGQCQKRIAAGIEPELSESRKAEKARLTGSPKDTPLIFTGQLRSSIRSKVSTGGGSESGH